MLFVEQVLDKLGKLYSEMIFVQGYIHCDPHPGNLFVRKTTAGVQIILLDHGLYQVLLQCMILIDTEVHRVIIIEHSCQSNYESNSSVDEI